MRRRNYKRLPKETLEVLNLIAKKNTHYNEDGHITISEDDPWFYEDVWDRYYKELEKRTAKVNDFQVQNVPMRLVLENVEVIELAAKQVKSSV